jgi:Uma2 family endonuclease
MTSSLPVITEIIPVVLQLPSAITMTDDQFYEFCQINRDFRIERNAAGELMIMSDTKKLTNANKSQLFLPASP